MQVAKNISLVFIDLLQLDNWSVQTLLDSKVHYSNRFELAKIGEFLIKDRTSIDIEDDKVYRRVTVKINNNGVTLRDTEKGINIGTKKQFVAKSGQFIISKIDARNGAFGVIPNELEGAIVTNDFPLFNVNTKRINPQFLLLITTTKEFIKFAQSCSSGTTNRQRMDVDLFLNQKIPLPSMEEQNEIINNYNKKIKEAHDLAQQAKDLEGEIEKYLFDALGIEKKADKVKRNFGLQFTTFEIISEWGIDKIQIQSNKKSSRFPITSIEETPMLANELFRGKSPKYKEGTNTYILNQKCNRWNQIDLSFVKTVDENWMKSISHNNFTKDGDILINSTGEGTIGRATYITKEFEGLMYDSHLLLLRLNRAAINAELFVEIFNSEYGQNQVNEIKSAQATKQTELGVTNLTKIYFPLPADLSIQNMILQRIKELKLKKNQNQVNSVILQSEASQDFERAIFN